MRNYKRFLLSVIIVSTLALAPTAAFSASTEAPVALINSEMTQALNQSWLPQAVKTSDKFNEPISASQFTELLEAAFKSANVTINATIPEPDGTFTREKAASIINSLIKVPYAESITYKDLSLDNPYSEAISKINQAGLMQGTGNHVFGYGKTITNGEAAVVAYRLSQYLQPFLVSEASISEMQQAMESGRLTAEALVQQYLDRIEKYDHQGPALNSILTINPEAITLAKELDAERISKGARSPLHGIPVIAKDNYNTADMVTTSGNIGLKDVLPANDATIIKQLKDAGAIIIGKANLHEFAFGYTTVSSLGGQTLNPYDLSHVPGGSSGGTAVAVTANLAAVGLGTDTGGSIRIPSSFNSLVGIRPTVGLTSRCGIAPLALAQDTGGPMARSVADAALILNLTTGYDPKDIATAKNVGNVPEDYTDYLMKDGLEGARIGIVREVFGENEEVNAVMNQTIKDMKAAGAILVDNVSIPNFDIINKYGSLSAWEFKFQFNDYLKSLGAAAPYASLDELIKSGNYDPSIEATLKQRNDRESLDSEEYKDILLFRTKFVQEAVLEMMADNQLDALIFPTSANPPVTIGEEQTVGDAFKLSSFTGWPTVTVPAGFTTNGLPVGIDFIGRAFSEPELIKLAYSYEQHTLHRKAPKLTP